MLNKSISTVVTIHQESIKELKDYLRFDELVASARPEIDRMKSKLSQIFTYLTRAMEWLFVVLSPIVQLIFNRLLIAIAPKILPLFVKLEGKISSFVCHLYQIEVDKLAKQEQSIRYPQDSFPGSNPTCEQGSCSISVDDFRVQDLSALTKAELVKEAKKSGINPGKMTKAQLLSAILQG